VETFFIFVCIVLTIIAVSVIITSWIKHRSPRLAGDARREIELLTNENSGLKGQVGRLEERLAVLERIATDPAERTAREIEQLRRA
jgi:hypothetical protein